MIDFESIYYLTGKSAMVPLNRKSNMIRISSALNDFELFIDLNT
jgi:hypothetical protein